MSNSSLDFSATLPPFYYTSGTNTNFSNSNLSASGNVALATTKDGVTGATSTTISSSINSNGVNYAETGASLNGNVLTVNYQSSTAPNSITTNINGNGVDFSPQHSTTNGNAVTTAYNTNPNNHFNLTVDNAARSTSTSDTGQNLVLKSLAVVGNSLTATYQLTSDLPNNLVLAPSSAPDIQKATITSQEPSSVNLQNNGATFSSRGYKTIGDVLAAANGINFNGTLGGALQAQGQGQANGIPAANAILAATLNPNLNLAPNSSLDVSDFIDTGLSSFQTNNTSPSSNTNNNSSSTFTNQGNGGSAFTSSSNDTSPANNNSPTGVYNAIANASASNIRGSGVNTVA